LNYDTGTLHEKEIHAKRQREREVPDGYATAKDVLRKVWVWVCDGVANCSHNTAVCGEVAWVDG